MGAETAIRNVNRTPAGPDARAPLPADSVARSTWSRSFSLVLALAACAAATGWFVDELYAENGATLEAIGRYGDLAILVLTVPIGLGAFLLERRGSRWARALMLGVGGHVGFMHSVLAFNYRENALFVVYTVMVGLCLLLSITGLVDFARSVGRPTMTPTLRLASAALLAAAVGGYAYWSSDVVSALVDDTTAESLSGTDLPANAARVVDMAVVLPLTAYGAAKLWAGRSVGLAVSAVMSTFLLLIGVTVVIMEIGLVRTNDVDLDVGKVAGFVFTISLSLAAAIITYRALGRGVASIADDESER